jgi:hypothetical protein
MSFGLDNFVFMGLGLLFVLNPNIYRRGMLEKPSHLQYKRSVKSNTTLMRVLGVMLIIVGFLWKNI